MSPKPTVKNSLLSDSLRESARRLVRNFFPRKELLARLAQELVADGTSSDEALEIAAREVAHLISEASDVDCDWNFRLEKIFHGEYPPTAREFRIDRGFGQRFGTDRRTANRDRHTFMVESFEPCSAPTGLISRCVAPNLYRVVTDEKGRRNLLTTAEVARLHRGDPDAVEQSNLYQVECWNRPVHRSGDREWSPINSTHLPVRRVWGRPTCSNVDPSLLCRFVDDLKTAFAFTSEGELANYLGYCLQPMLSHYYSGENPAYSFQGPTGSGKTLLARGLANRIYRRHGVRTALSGRMPTDEHEMRRLIGRSHQAVYLVFDEMKDASFQQMTMMNELFTSEYIHARVPHQREHEVKNLFTFAMTAVKYGFYDETHRRIVQVTLEEPRTESISKLMLSWNGRWSALLATMHAQIQLVDISEESLPKLPNRGPGFALITKAVKQVFGVDVSYGLGTSENDLWDEIIGLFEADHNKPGSRCGIWHHYCVKDLHDYMRSQGHDRGMTKSDLKNQLEAAFARGSTESHPAYKESGYTGPLGKRYHLAFTTHGKKELRDVIKIRPIKKEVVPAVDKDDFE